MDMLAELKEERKVKKRYGKKLISLKSHYIFQVYQQRVAMTGEVETGPKSGSLVLAALKGSLHLPPPITVSRHWTPQNHIVTELLS